MKKIAIVGGGASGVLAMLHLNGHDLTVYEPAEGLGAGLAYGTDEAFYLLNVPAARLSYCADRPWDFVHWLKRSHPEALRDPYFPFVPRSLYRAYLQDRVSEVEFQRRRDQVLSLRPENGGWWVRTASEESWFHHCVIATGYRADLDPSPLFWEGPGDWREGEARSSVAILGAGLTAIDQWRKLRADGFDGTVHFLSRRGMFPESHLPVGVVLPAPLSLPPLPDYSPLEILRLARGLRREFLWPAIADAIRPQVQGIWRRWGIGERSRFLRHLRPYWELIRHRVPARVWWDLENELARGKITLRRARVEGSGEEGGRKWICYRSEGRRHRLVVDKIYLATGAVPAALPEGAAPGLPGIHVLGPAARDLYWETTAIAEIRSLAAEVAANLGPSRASPASHQIEARSAPPEPSRNHPRTP